MRTLADAGIGYARRPALTIRMENQPGVDEATFRNLAEVGVNADLPLPVRVSDDLFFELSRAVRIEGRAKRLWMPTEMVRYLRSGARITPVRRWPWARLGRTGHSAVSAIQCRCGGVARSESADRQGRRACRS